MACGLSGRDDRKRSDINNVAREPPAPSLPSHRPGHLNDLEILAHDPLRYEEVTLRKVNGAGSVNFVMD